MKRNRDLAAGILQDENLESPIRLDASRSGQEHGREMLKQWLQEPAGHQPFHAVGFVAVEAAPPGWSAWAVQELTTSKM